MTLKSRAEAGTPESCGAWVEGAVVIVDPHRSGLGACMHRPSGTSLDTNKGASRFDDMKDIPLNGILSMDETPDHAASPTPATMPVHGQSE
jgi:hypothetical protein